MWLINAILFVYFYFSCLHDTWQYIRFRPLCRINQCTTKYAVNLRSCTQLVKLVVLHHVLLWRQGRRSLWDRGTCPPTGGHVPPPNIYEGGDIHGNVPPIF